MSEYEKKIFTIIAKAGASVAISYVIYKKLIKEPRVQRFENCGGYIP